MFTKILIAEDEDSDNLGIVAKLRAFTDTTVEAAQFCDKTLLMIKKAIQDKTPYQLLVSDLSFSLDHKQHRITSGKQLIRDVKKIQPGIKVIVFSQENKPAIIKSLFDTYHIDGYVCKGLHGLPELMKAIHTIYQGATYSCPIAQKALLQRNPLQLSDYEVTILSLLSEGYKQEEISQYFITHNIHPYSKRSIEDRLRKLREHFNATTNVQLAVTIEKLGLLA